MKYRTTVLSLTKPVQIQSISEKKEKNIYHKLVHERRKGKPEDEFSDLLRIVSMKIFFSAVVHQIGVLSYRNQPK